MEPGGTGNPPNNSDILSLVTGQALGNLSTVFGEQGSPEGRRRESSVQGHRNPPQQSGFTCNGRSACDQRKKNGVGAGGLPILTASIKCRGHEGPMLVR